MRYALILAVLAVGCTPAKTTKRYLRSATYRVLPKKGYCRVLDGFVGVNIGDALIQVKSERRWKSQQTVTVRYANGEVHEGSVIIVDEKLLELDVAEPKEWKEGEMVLVYPGPLPKFKKLGVQGRLRKCRRTL